MQQLLLKFRSQIQRNFVFSVVMGKCYVAIPVKEDLFEPADNPDGKEEIKKYFFSGAAVAGPRILNATKPTASNNKASVVKMIFRFIHFNNCGKVN